MYARDHGTIATPIGLIRVEGDETALFAIRIGAADGPRQCASTAPVRTALIQLERYFAGDLTTFDLALPVLASLRGRELRQGLIEVGYAQTVSYGELAQRLCSGARAIGQLCARNPLPIVIPCHRVLGAGGALGSYSAGDGPTTKHWLLDHERRHLKGSA